MSVLFWSLGLAAMLPVQQLRRRIRMLRQGLSEAQREQAARLLAIRVAALEVFAGARRIAGYLAFDGEQNPAPLLEKAWAIKKSVYLPVVDGKDLLFAPYDVTTPLKANRFGIPEPDTTGSELLKPQSLDLVLTPLVAFDSQGNRLGMGGGFYDRSFAFCKGRSQTARPLLLGLAYELQRVVELPCRPWDVPLDAIATERALYPGREGLGVD